MKVEAITLRELQMPLKNACLLMATPRVAEVLVFGALECVGGHCRSLIRLCE